MKKLYLLMLALLSCIASANAQTKTVGEICYNIITYDESTSTYEAEVTSKENGYEGNITIPTSFQDDKIYKVIRIGYNAFNECTKLKSVIIEDGVTSIDGNVFSGCTELTSVVIPNSVTSIGWNAFSGCNKLTSVNIPDGVKTIESGTFSGCESLTSIDISNVTKIGEGAFRGCSKLTGVKLNNQLTTIESNTFYGCESLSSITIPDGVTTIKGWAFYNCTSLESIIIPNSVTAIGNKVDSWSNGSTFSNCTKLSSVTLSNQLETIEDGTFQSCSSLESITIPSSVTKIGNGAFGGCSGLNLVTSEMPAPIEIKEAFDWQSYEAALVVPKGARAAYKSSNGWKEFAVTFEQGETICASKKTDDQGINYNLRQADDYSVYYTVTGHTEELKAEIVIPAKIEDCPVKSIEPNAFSGCTNLTKITIPNSVTSIGNYAFQSCENIKVVTSEILEPFAVETNAFAWWYYNATLVVPEGKRADYKKLEGWNNFAFTIEEGEPIYDVPLEQTDKQGLTYRLKQADDYSVYYSVMAHTDELEGDIVIPAELDGCPVGAIEDYALQNCTKMTSITFLNDVKVMGSNAFYGCGSLDEVKVYVWDDAEFCNNHILGGFDNPIGYSDGNNWNEKYFTIHLIKKDSEGIENEISDFVVPESVTSIGNGAFKGYTNLLSIKMGKNITSIGDYAFFGCTSLESITLPKKLESIGNSAFSGKYSSSDYNYHGCPLTSITIPGSVKTIGNNAFAYCHDLALVTFGTIDEDEEGGLTSIGDEAFKNCCFTSITLPKSVKTIGKMAFADNNNLTSAILGESLTEIKEQTFNYCGALKSVTIPDGVTNIGERAFRGCYNLTSVKIPQSLTSMGENVFENCPLKSIDLPNSFTAIPANLFQNNDFEYIKLGNNVKSIGKNAFGSKLEGDEAQVVIEIGTSTPPSIAKDAFPYLIDLWSVINVIVPDATAEKAYQNAAVWKEMTYANLNNDVVVTVSTDNVGFLSDALIDQHGLMPAKVAGLKIKGTINEDDFKQMRNNFKSLLRLDLSDCDITAIPDGAFKGKTQLQELTLPTKLQTIGRSAFQGCSYLTGKLNLPSGVTAIGNSAFEGTYYTSVTLPRSLKSIGDSAFYNLPIKQTLASLPEGLSSIGKYAFAETKVYDPILFPHSINELGDGAFRNTQISDVALPSKITSLNLGVFQGCTNLSGIVDVLVNYTEVAGYAFDGCTSLTHLRLSPNLTRMGEYAFQNTSVGYVNIPSRVKIIAQGVFKNCKKLESLALPANLEKLSGEALYGCSGLRNLSVEAIEPPIAEKTSMIGVNTDLCLISIPTASFSKYIKADYWGQFVNQRNDIGVVTEGNGDIAFESVEGGEEEEAQARARARQIMHARARTRGTTEAETELMYVNSGSSVYIPKEEDGTGKVRFYIIPKDGESIEKATLDGEDITKQIVDGVYTATAKKRNGELIVIFSGKAEEEVITTPIKIGDKGKTTLTSSEALDFSGFTDLKAYVATGYEGNGTVWLTRITQVPANTPVLVKGAANEIYNVPVMDKCDAYYENLFVGSAEEDIEIRFNSYEDSRSWHNYYMAGGQFKPAPDWSANNGQTIKAGKCYLRVPEWFDYNWPGEEQTFTIAKSGKSSYAPPVNVDVTNVEGLKAYAATGYDPANSVIWLTRINKIPAGTGVILKGEPGKTYTLPSGSVEAYYGNMFVGNINNSITIGETSEDGLWTNFYLASGSFKKVSGTRGIDTNKSYLHLPTSLLVSGARGRNSAIAEEWLIDELETEIMHLGSIGGDDEDGTTRINAIGNESAQPDVYYNLQGQRVDNPGKGVYIRNGKKVIIK